MQRWNHDDATGKNKGTDLLKPLLAAGVRDRVKIMIGGAPVTEDYFIIIKGIGITFEN